MLVRRVNVSLEEVDPTGVYKAIFLQYIEEIDGRELKPATLGALRQKYGLNLPQFRAQEWAYLEEKRKQREKEREQRRNSRSGGNRTGDLADGNRGTGSRGDRLHVNLTRDRGEGIEA